MCKFVKLNFKETVFVCGGTFPSWYKGAPRQQTQTQQQPQQPQQQIPGQIEPIAPTMVFHNSRT